MVIPVTLVVRLLGVAITGVTGPETKLQVDVPFAVPLILPTRVADEVQVFTFSPELTVQL